MRCALMMLSAAFLFAGVRASSHQQTLEFADTKLMSESAVNEAQGARIFDRFGAISSNNEKARLDNFAIELQSDPSITGYIIVYGRRTRPGEAKKRADRIKQYLWYSRGLGENRLESLDHCFRTRLEVELWIVPQRARAPVPCPVRAKVPTKK